MNNNERYISVSGLVRGILLKWRWMLAIGLLFALLLGGYKFRGGFLKGQKKDALSEEEKLLMDSYDAELERIEENLLRKNRYLEQSILVKIDPAAEGRATAIISVRTDEMEDEDGTVDLSSGSVTIPMTTNQTVQNTIHGVSSKSRRAVLILSNYVNKAVYGNNWDNLTIETETKDEYLNELVSLDGEDDSIVSARIKVIYPDSEGAETILKYILDSLRASKSEVEQAYGSHELIIGNVLALTIPDRTLNNWMKDRVQEINDLSVQRDNFRKNMASASFLSSGEVMEGIASASKQAVKYGIIGLIGGFAAFVFFYAIRLIVSGRETSGREVNTQYQLKKLAVLPGTYHGFDAVVDRIDAGYRSGVDMEKALGIARENIQSNMEKGEMPCKIALVGDIPEEEMIAIGEKLNDENTIICVPLTSLNQCADSISKLNECEKAVILIKTLYSNYRLLDDIIETLRVHDKQIIGSIVLS